MIEFEYYIDAGDILDGGTEFTSNAGQEITLICECDYDYSTDFGPECTLVSAKIMDTRHHPDDWRDILGLIHKELKEDIECEALEQDAKKAEMRMSMRQAMTDDRRKMIAEEREIAVRRV